MNPITALLQAMGFGLDQGTALAQAMQGDRPNPRVQSGPILNADGTVAGPQSPEAGAGRGFINPPVPVLSRPAPALRPLSAIPQVNIQRPPVAPGPVLAGAMPPALEAASASPDTTPDNRDAGGGDRTPMMAPVEDRVGTPVTPQPGIFSRLMDDSKTGVSPLEYLLRGFTAAGTADPAKTMMMFASQDTENEKIKQAKRKASQGETKYLGNGMFAEYAPDGKLLRTYIDPTAAAVEEKARDGKYTADVNKAVVIDRLARDRDQTKTDTRAAEEAGPQLRQVQTQLDAINVARETLPRMGVMDQLKGATGRMGSLVASMADPQMNIDSQRRAAVRVLDWVRSSEPLKGALSNVEGLKLDMPLPEAFASKEEWQAYFDNSERVLKAAEEYLKKQVGRGASATQPNPNAPATSQASPPSSDQLRAAVTAAGIPFEPDKFDYRFGPNGQIQRKAK